MVGPPAGLETVSVPSTVATRVVSPSSPPPGSIRAPPTPLSSISTTTTSVRRVDREPRAALPRACLAAFVSASATTKYAVDSTATDGRSPTSTEISTGIGLRAASAESAASRPRSVRIAGWIPRARLRSSARACFESSCACSTSARARVRIGVELRAGAAEVDRERRQPLLGAVVEIALDPPPLGDRGVDGLGALPRQLLDPLGRAAAEERAHREGMRGREQAEQPRQQREDERGRRASSRAPPAACRHRCGSRRRTGAAARPVVERHGDEREADGPGAHGDRRTWRSRAGRRRAGGRRGRARRRGPSCAPRAAAATPSAVSGSIRAARRRCRAGRGPASARCRRSRSR